MTVELRGEDLTLSDLAEVALRGRPVRLHEPSLVRVAEAHARVQEWGEQRRPMYGVNTGFGELTHFAVDPRHRTELQTNLVRSHAAGAGEPFPDTVVRAIMLARLNCLLKGYSGVSVATVELLAALLNAGVCPVIPQQGSLGASGDLAPLSHMALTVIGEGEVTVGGRRTDAAAALAAHGLRPVELGFKEGLALVNGTSAMTGVAALALVEAKYLLEVAVLLSAAFVQCLRGSTRAYDARGHDLRGHAGQRAVAASLVALLDGSELTSEHEQLMSEIEGRRDDARSVTDTGVYIQHAYTLRCIPQILGPALDTWPFCAGVVERELNSPNDNPLIFETADASFHGGNFHGQYVAMACDYLAIALTEIGVLAERQVNRLLDPSTNGALPDFLAAGERGLSCGLMGIQYLATSIASENLDLAAPSSVKTIPSNAQNQDVVSMGLAAARRCLRLARNVEAILSVLATACYQASSLLGHERFSPPIRAWLTELAKLTDAYEESRVASEHVETVRRFVFDGPGRDVARSHVDLG